MEEAPHTSSFKEPNDVNTAEGQAEPPSQRASSTSPVQRIWQEYIRKNLLVIFLVLGMIGGISIGAGIKTRDKPLTKRQLMYLQFPGEILMNMLQLIILPLIVSSLISGMTSLETKTSGKIGIMTMAYYLTTTLIAVITGIILVIVIRPGDGASPERLKSNHRRVEAVDTFLDLIRQMFPSNIIEACFSKKLTYLVPVTRNKTEEELTKNPNETTITEYIPKLKSTNGINMLGMVVFSIALGISINRLGMKGKPVKCLVESFCDACMLLVSAIIWYSPIGVMFLIAQQIAGMEDIEGMFTSLSFYVLTVMCGLTFHGFITLPLLYLFFVRKNPITFIRGISHALFTALGTSSSSATMPVTMQNLKDNCNIDPRVISFMIPVGATINMDGTALYEAVAVIFIGQVRGLDLSFPNVVSICLTSTAAAIGAAGVPQAGLVTMVLVLTAVGFPTEDIGLILAVDWFLDRFRTMVNVLGDAIGTGIINKHCVENMEKSGSNTRVNQVLSQNFRLYEDDQQASDKGTPNQ